MIHPLYKLKNQVHVFFCQTERNTLVTNSTIITISSFIIQYIHFNKIKSIWLILVYIVILAMWLNHHLLTQRLCHDSTIFCTTFKFDAYLKSIFKLFILTPLLGMCPYIYTLILIDFNDLYIHTQL